MAQSRTKNRQIVLASRPEGEPKPHNFNLIENDTPSPAEGEVLLRTIYLSLDPYMRSRMSDAESYAEPVAINGVMVGGSICCVEESKHTNFSQGDLVVAFGGWQDYSISNGEGLLKLDKSTAKPSHALGPLGMPGLTAYMGLMDIGEPQTGETLVVAAASGAVGSLVGQIGKLKGCRVVGIAGSAEKCHYVENELGFDACLNHNDPDLAAQLAKACPRGIDIYFENVGGKILDAVIPLLNTKARIPLCGLISQYNATDLPAGPNLLPQFMRQLLTKRVRIKGFIVFDDYGHRYGEFQQAMTPWVMSEQIKYKEHKIAGLENASTAFIGLLKGENFGKLIVQVGPEKLDKK